MLKLININSLDSKRIKNHWRRNSLMTSMASKISKVALKSHFQALVIEPLIFPLFFLLKQTENMSAKSCKADVLPFNVDVLRHHYFNVGMFLFSVGALKEMWVCKIQRLTRVFAPFSQIFSLSLFLHPKAIFPTFFT